MVLLTVALLLSGCGALQPAATPLPTVVLDDSPAGGPAAAASGTNRAQAQVTASGVIAPAAQVELALAASGSVQSVDAAVGQAVEAGDVLVRLAGSEKLTAAVEAAEFELLAAQQAVTEINDNAAQARAAAMLRLANASDAFDKAERRRGWKEYRVGDDNQIDVARADVILAEETLRRTEEVYGGYADNPEDNLNKAAALSALSAARKARDKAQANLNYLLSLPNDFEVAKADAELEVARAELDAAQREVERTKDGPDPAAMTLAQARVENANTQLSASRAALADLELRAPRAGVVVRVDLAPGEWATAGQPVLVIADLAHLRVETTDLSERDVPQVSVGQPALVQVESLNLELPGRVAQIAPLAGTLGGDVVYQTIIELEEIPPALRAGMSVEVQFMSGE